MIGALGPVAVMKALTGRLVESWKVHRVLSRPVLLVDRLQRLRGLIGAVLDWELRLSLQVEGHPSPLFLGWVGRISRKMSKVCPYVVFLNPGCAMPMFCLLCRGLEWRGDSACFHSSASRLFSQSPDRGRKHIQPTRRKLPLVGCRMGATHANRPSDCVGIRYSIHTQCVLNVQ